MRATLPALAAAALIGAGCVKVDQALTINKNGSATYELSYEISEQVVEQMRAMFELHDYLAGGPGAPDGLPELDGKARVFFDPEQTALTRLLAEYAQYGVALERISVESRRGVREVRLKATVTQLATLATSDLFPDYGFSLAPNERGNYELYRAPGNFGEEYPLNVNDPDTARMLQPFLGGFRITTKIQAPGQVVESNAGNVTRYAAVWTQDYDTDPEALLKLQREPMRLVFEGRGVNIPAIKQGL